MAGRRGSWANAPAAAEFMPVHEWHDGDGGNYLLSISLPGFKKEEFRVQVDTAGRLTVTGQRPADGRGAGIVRLHKVFQLPPTSNLDEITGRFDGSVLSLTVPKLPTPGAVEAERAKDQAGEGAGCEAERPIETARAKLAPGSKKEEVKEQTGKNGKKLPTAKKVGDEQEQPKAEPVSLPSHQKLLRQVDEDEKRNVAEYKANLERTAERMIKAGKARLAAERETEKNGRWKERVEEEGLMLTEAIGNRKEVIATAVAVAVAVAVAAFAFGLLVSHKLFSRN